MDSSGNPLGGRHWIVSMAATAVIVALGTWVSRPKLAIADVSAQGHGHGGEHWRQGRDHDAEGEDEEEGRAGRQDRPASLRVMFTERERAEIGDYYRHQRGGLPPGLAKRGGNLPPGLEKHLERDGQLPPGLQKRLAPLPPPLDRRLPRLPPVYVRGTIGADVVIMNTKTGRIADIIRGVVGGH